MYHIIHQSEHILYSDFSFKIPSSTKKNEGSLKHWLIPNLEQDTYKISLEHLIVLIVKEDAENHRNMKEKKKEHLQGDTTGLI